MKTRFEELMDDISQQIEQPLVSARFGDKWREHQKQMLKEGQITPNDIIDIAWKQGRRAILLEREIERLTASEWIKSLIEYGADSLDDKQRDEALRYVRWIKSNP